MNYKTSISILLPLLFLVNFCSGQKLRDKNVTLKYVQLPERLLPEDYLTYSVQVTGGTASMAGQTSERLAQDVKLDGFKRMSGIGDENGHLRIRINTGWVYAGYGELKTVSKKKKDKEGNETTTTSYHYEFPVRANTSYFVYDPDGAILISGDKQYQEVMSSKSFSSASKLRDSYTSHKENARKSFAKSTIQSQISEVKRAIIPTFDYNNAKTNFELYTIKKHDDDKRFESLLETVKATFENYNYDKSSDQLREELASELEFLKSRADKDPRGDKKLMKLHVASNYNLALLSYILDDFEEAKLRANRVLSSEGKHAKSKKLLSKIEHQSALMELNGVNTLHYYRDLGDAMAPAKISALEAIKEEIEENNEVLAGVIKMNGEEIEGSFKMANEATEMSFGPKGNTSFIYEEKGEVKEVDLSLSAVTNFNIGSREFKKMTFSPCAKGKSEPDLHLLEIIYDSDKIKLYKFYPSGGNIENTKSEFAFKKQGETSPVSLLDTQFLLWNKGLSNYFSDCADLAEMVKTGDIKLDLDDLIKAARIYSELCE